MNHPIRVLCVFSQLDRGGSESMCMNLYRIIDRSQIQFDFVKHTPAVGTYEAEITSLGGRIFEAPRYLGVNHWAYCRWWKAHFQAHPEHRIIHGHYYTIASVYFKLAHQFGRITVAHSHSTSAGKLTPKTLLSHLWLSRINKHSDYRLACSVPAGKWLFHNAPFTVFHNAIDSMAFTFNAKTRNEVRAEFGLTDQNRVLGTVGSIFYPKNPHGVIDILQETRKRDPNVKMLWAGNGPMRQEAEERIRREGLESSCQFLGNRDDVNRLLQAMDVFILPSIYEGLPVVAVEAQAAGLPCILSDVIAEETNFSGLCRFLPISDPAHWAETVLSIDPTVREDTRQKVVDAGYDITTTAAWLTDFYRNISQKDE